MMSKRIIGVGIFVIAIFFVYWTISPFFRHVHIDDALPTAPEQTLASTSDSASSGSLSPGAATAVSVIGTTGHPAEGTARIVSGGGKTYVRYENFKTLDGPDIYVYLSKDLDAKEFVSLGKVKATEGNINYEIPSGTHIEDYPYVLTWCKTFGVLFNSAKLR